MTRQRTIVVLLAVFCVLLALNLVKGEPEAQAEPQSAEGVGDGACCLPDGSCSFINATQCASLGGTHAGVGVLCVSVNCAPVVPVEMSVTPVPGLSIGYRVFRMWSDGSVDTTRITFDGTNCDIVMSCTREVPIAPSCPADITADGSVNVLDLVELLLVFGVTCPS